MQDIFLQNFNKDINSVREYIKHIDLINKVEVNNRNSNEESLKEFTEHLHKFGTDKKLFEYKSIVISLYGILEKYISIWIQEHIELIPSLIQSYDKLPEKIGKNHFDLSIKLISLISENKFDKYEHLRKEDVLIRLSACISTPSNYKLNSDSFTLISGNLKHIKIVEAFKYLDIDLVNKLKVNTIFSEFLKKKYGDGIANKGNELFSQINDLVTRRNDIAHGENIDEILNISEFDDYIDFLEKYGQAIFDTLVEKELEYEANFLCKKIENVKDVYNNSILCFETESSRIKVGDFIIINSGNSFIKKEILSIQKDNISSDELNIIEKTDIGVNLGGGIKKNQVFYIRKS